MTFKLFIWRVKYSFYMYKKSDMPFTFCWGESIGCIYNIGDDWMSPDYPPSYCAEEDMSCWSD